MKTYINAELQIVRMNNRDIVTESFSVNTAKTVDTQYAPGFRDFEDYSY